MGGVHVKTSLCQSYYKNFKSIKFEIIAPHPCPLGLSYTCRSHARPYVHPSDYFLVSLKLRISTCSRLNTWAHFSLARAPRLLSFGIRSCSWSGHAQDSPCHFHNYVACCRKGHLPLLKVLPSHSSLSPNDHHSSSLMWVALFRFRTYFNWHHTSGPLYCRDIWEIY